MKIINHSNYNPRIIEFVCKPHRFEEIAPVNYFAYIMNNLDNPFKAIQIGYSFRAERPQRGRNRQFIQCDIDILGDESVESEIDVLTTGLLAYQKLGFEQVGRRPKYYRNPREDALILRKEVVR